MKHAAAISPAMTSGFSKLYNESAAKRAMTNALAKTDLADVTFDNRRLRGDRFHFSVKIPTMPVTDQKSSGRCWLFAGLNLLREEVAKKCRLESFELSQNYIAFWDKYEKINYFLESVIDLIDNPPYERTLCWILSTGVQDGGQWDMFVSLVEKYGIVPKEAMDETYQSSHTNRMNQLLNRKLRQYAARLQRLHREGAGLEALQKEKEAMLEEMYGFLCTCLGDPPASFDFACTDKEKEYHIDRNLTPRQFYDKYIGLALEDYVSVIHSPTEDKPYYQSYTVDYLGNVVGGHDIRYLNLPMEELTALVVKQLQDGRLVWFGSDVAPCGDRERGIWDIAAFDYQSAFGMDFSMSKADMLDYRESAMNHAMVITGVDLDEAGKPTRWKIQNSWADKNGDKGYYLMSADWFDMYVYQAVIHKDYLSAAQLEAYRAEPKHLTPWDPMGTLAD